jgi:hypothetical protein
MMSLSPCEFNFLSLGRRSQPIDHSTIFSSLQSQPCLLLLVPFSTSTAIHLSVPFLQPSVNESVSPRGLVSVDSSVYPSDPYPGGGPSLGILKSLEMYGWCRMSGDLLSKSGKTDLKIHIKCIKGHTDRGLAPEPEPDQNCIPLPYCSDDNCTYGSQLSS